jgi:hypothetical protein
MTLSIGRFVMMPVVALFFLSTATDYLGTKLALQHLSLTRT